MSDIPLFEISWDETDIANVVESVSRGGYWAKGPFVDQFEEGLEEYFGVEHALVVNSGTTALECALRAFGVGPGDEVLVPSFTFIATANVVELVGANPVFVDIERETLGMDPADAREKVTDDTALILPIHCYGSPCKIEELMAVAEEANVPLLEDAAEAFGAVADGQQVGTFGDAAALSFCQNKILPTGEGGAVLTDDGEVASSIELFRSHGRVQGRDYFESSDSGEYTSVGTNYRMPDVVAALGCSQLAKVDSLLERRRQIAEAYTTAFKSIAHVETITGRNKGEDANAFQLYSILLEDTNLRISVTEALTDCGIASKVYWDPAVHQTKYYRNRAGVKLPVTEDIAGRTLSLPMYPDMDVSDAEMVVGKVKTILES